MKFIRIIILSLLALGLVACAAIFILFQTFDPDQYLPQIVKKSSSALGRPVSVEHLGLGLSSRGITLDAGPVIIADDASFTAQPFIQIDRIRVSVDLRSLILQRRVNITGILLQSPRVHFIRSQEGDFNVRSIGPKKVTDTFFPGVPASPKGEVISDRKVGTDTTFFIKTSVCPYFIKIQDASISYIDQDQTFPMDIWLTDIQASTRISLDISNNSISITNLNLKTDLSRLDIKWPKDNLPFKDIAGDVQFNMAHLDIGGSESPTGNGDVIITGGIIKDFNIIKTLLSHTLGGFGGNIDGILNGKLKNNLGADDTIIDNAHAQFSLHDKAFFIDDSVVQTNIFELTAKGSVDQGSNMDLQTMLHLNNDLSTALVNELDGLKYLMDDSKRIAIGASLKGGHTAFKI